MLEVLDLFLRFGRHNKETPDPAARMVSQEDIADPKQLSIAKQAPQSLDLANDGWDPGRFSS